MTSVTLNTTQGNFEVSFFHVRNRREDLPEYFEYEFTPEEEERNRLMHLDYTVAYAFSADGNGVYSSRAIRHPHDRFERKTGRDLALERLKKNIEETSKYDSYFDGDFEVVDMIIDRHGSLEHTLSMFKPETRNKIMKVIATEFSGNNLSGDFIIESIKSHYDAQLDRHAGRFKLTGGNK